MAKAAIETACWDLEAKKLNVPLWRHLGGVNQEISCGVSIGIHQLSSFWKRFKRKLMPGISGLR